MFVIGFPLLLIPFTIFNIIVFLMPDLRLDTAVATVPLISGRIWAVTLGDALVLLSILLLLIEVIKAARPGAKFAMDHLLSLVLFGAAACEFALLPRDQIANSAFAFLVALMFVDAIAGISISLRRRSQRRADAAAYHQPAPPVAPSSPPPAAAVAPTTSSGPPPLPPTEAA